jgi:DNA-binding transcriptional LysR family regulator
MDTDVLRWFQQVADGVTVTEVSDLDRVTQSGVSRALARLEAEVGTAVLRRSGRTLRMTRAGAAFKGHVDALLHELDDGLAAVSQLVDPETGTVTMAFQLPFGSWLVPDLVASFRARHPEVRFELHHVQDRDGPAVHLATADLLLTTARSADRDIEWRRLFTEPMHLVLPASHPMAGRTDVGLVDVAAEPFIMLRSPFSLRQLTELLCANAGFSPSIPFETDDLSTIRGLVAAGLGVAIIPALSDRPDPFGHDLWSVAIADPAATREVGLAWSKRHALLPSAELFRKHVLERTAEMSRIRVRTG